MRSSSNGSLHCVRDESCLAIACLKRNAAVDMKEVNLACQDTLRRLRSSLPLAFIVRSHNTDAPATKTHMVLMVRENKGEDSHLMATAEHALCSWKMIPVQPQNAAISVGVIGRATRCLDVTITTFF